MFGVRIGERKKANFNQNQSSFYRPFHATHEGKAIGTLFSTQDPDEHKRFKRPVAQKFSMTSMRSMEYLVDPCGKIFTDAMVELQGEVVDLGEWLQWYAFDVIGAITFSKRFGFMESRKDLGDVMVGLDVLTKYGSMAGQISWLTRLSESVWLRGMVKDPFPIVTKVCCY
jgi:cytochrome P450